MIENSCFMEYESFSEILNRESKKVAVLDVIDNWRFMLIIKLNSTSFCSI